MTSIRLSCHLDSARDYSAAECHLKCGVSLHEWLCVGYVRSDKFPFSESLQEICVILSLITALV